MHSIGLHIKILTPPAIPIETLVGNMREVYSSVGIQVELLSTEELDLPELNDVDVGICVSPHITEEQRSLFLNRDNVGPNEICVYFVRSTIPPLNGCAAHQPGSPSAVVVSNASPWTLAHEVGHILGLRHVLDRNRLMTGVGTSNITNPPPDLVLLEHQTMLASGLISVPPLADSF